MSNIKEEQGIIQAMIDQAMEEQVNDAYDRLHEILYSEKKGKITPQQADTIIKCLNGADAMCEDMQAEIVKLKGTAKHCGPVTGIETRIHELQKYVVELETKLLHANNTIENVKALINTERSSFGVSLFYC